MSLKVSNWRRTFSAANPPRFPCPRCSSGFLKIKKDMLHHAYSWEMRHLDLDENHITDRIGRFSCLFECNRANCGEVVAVAGDYFSEPFEYQNEDGDWDQDFQQVLAPRSMVPAPPVIDIPVQTPDEVRDAIESAFDLTWLDQNAAATRLRLSVELAIKDAGVPWKRDLGKTIDAFSEKYPKQTAGALHALRYVGNTATHHGKLKWTTLLEAFQIYEYWLRNFYGKEKEDIEALIAKLTQSKGKTVNPPKPSGGRTPAGS